MLNNCRPIFGRPAMRQLNLITVNCKVINEWQMTIGVQTDTVHSTVYSSVNIWFQHNHISDSTPNNDHNHDHFVNINKSLKIVLFVDLAFGIQGRSVIIYTLKKNPDSIKHLGPQMYSTKYIFFVFTLNHRRPV